MTIICSLYTPTHTVNIFNYKQLMTTAEKNKIKKKFDSEKPKLKQWRDNEKHVF